MNDLPDTDAARSPSRRCSRQLMAGVARPLDLDAGFDAGGDDQVAHRGPRPGHRSAGSRSRTATTASSSSCGRPTHSHRPDAPAQPVSRARRRRPAVPRARVAPAALFRVPGAVLPAHGRSGCARSWTTPSSSPTPRSKLEFFTRQFIDAMSPANFPWSNPEALKLAAETDGREPGAGAAQPRRRPRQGHDLDDRRDRPSRSAATSPSRRARWSSRTTSCS